MSARWLVPGVYDTQRCGIRATPGVRDPYSIDRSGNCTCCRATQVFDLKLTPI